MATNRGLSGTSEHFEIDSFALGLGAGDYLMTGRKDFYWDQGFNTIENLGDDIYRMNGFSRAQDFGDTAFIQAIYSPTDQIIVDKSCAHNILRASSTWTYNRHRQICWAAWISLPQTGATT